jgi:hypothetical protein
MVINPSSSGWFDKYINNYLSTEPLYADISSFYQAFRQNGFVYGKIISKAYQSADFELTSEEQYKLFYVKALFHLDRLYYQDENFLHRLIIFYKNTISENWLNINQYIVKDNSSAKLELIIQNRIKFYQGVVGNKYLQNTLLFLDVLLYYRYLNGEKINIHTLHFLEQFAESIFTHELKAKNFSLQSLFKPFYQFLQEQNKDDYAESIDTNLSDLGQLFFMDLAVINYYFTHKNFDDNHDLKSFGKSIKIDEETVELAINSFVNFVHDYANDYKILEKQMFHQALFSQTQSQLSLLVSRNQKRLMKEINNNKKLLSIIGQTPYKNLSVEERKYVKDQLLEISKTIPSLAIFVLPGGGLLLPILVRLLPQLLPNSFNENK